MLAVKVLRSDDSRVAKQLLQAHLQKNVPGFAQQVVEICGKIFGCTLQSLVEMSGEVRPILKEKLVSLQSERLMSQMLTQSKTDGLLMNSFNFSGRMKPYLDLPFSQARIIFMVRCRMILVKENFPGRWDGSLCNICRCRDTVEHLYSCPGFRDIVCGSVRHDIFFEDDVNLEELKTAADVMIKVNERLKMVQELS